MQNPTEIKQPDRQIPAHTKQNLNIKFIYVQLTRV